MYLFGLKYCKDKIPLFFEDGEWVRMGSRPVAEKRSGGEV